MRLKDEEREKDLRKNEKNVEQRHGKKDEDETKDEKRDVDEKNEKKDGDEKNQKKDDKKEDKQGELCEDLKTGMKKEHSVTQLYEIQVMMSSKRQVEVERVVEGDGKTLDSPSDFLPS